MIKENIKYIVPLIIILCLDTLYLSIVKSWFQKMIKNVQHTDIRFSVIPAIITYIIIFLGLYYFILSKKNPSILDAFLLGIFSYGIYEFTNLTTIKDWDPVFSTVDTLWGGILFASTTFLYLKLFTNTASVSLL